MTKELTPDCSICIYVNRPRIAATCAPAALGTGIPCSFEIDPRFKDGGEYWDHKHRDDDLELFREDGSLMGGA